MVGLKEIVRTQMLRERGKFTSSQTATYTSQLTNLLWSIVQERAVKVLHTYLPLPGEIDTLPLVKLALEAGIRVVVPKSLLHRQVKHLRLTNLESLQIGRFGTQYPFPEVEDLGPYDIIIVPGVAFDLEGNRIGYGAGYYDTFLSQQPLAWKVGLAFPFQILPHLPTEPHDVRLDQVLFIEV